MAAPTRMRAEIAEIPEAIARLVDGAPTEALAAAAEALRRRDPVAILTIGRGSSDHAATYLKYAIEITAGRPVASIGPSVASVFGAQLRVDAMAALAISQSGTSADIVALAGALRQAGADVFALTNSVESPLARTAHHPVDIVAGPERAVAATKSFVSSIVAGLRVLALWTGEAALERALCRLPTRVEAALAVEWGDVGAAMAEAQSLMILARGPALGLAAEAALKTMETCGVHASAYSAAEILHGPSTLLTDGFPVLVLGRGSVPKDGLGPTLERLEAQGAKVILPPSPGPTEHPLTDPLLEIARFYALIEAEARRRGRNPDEPAFLRKETSTV
ncbi:MAG: SIS domain-containing protein [Pseudomonadota bacterium]